MGDDEKTDPDKRALRSPCDKHGMQHGYFTQEDDGKRVELHCTEPDCDFIVKYIIRWPQAFKKRTCSP